MSTASVKTNTHHAADPGKCACACMQLLVWYNALSHYHLLANTCNIQPHKQIVMFPAFLSGITSIKSGHYISNHQKIILPEKKPQITIRVLGSNYLITKFLPGIQYNKSTAGLNMSIIYMQADPLRFWRSCVTLLSDYMK